MAKTIHEQKYMKFVSNQLNLPVFLASRNRIKSNFTPLQGYIGRNRLRYTNRCNEENDTETATFKKYKHIFDLEKEPPAQSCPTRPILKQSREPGRKSPWLLPPNTYELDNKPFADWKGLGGALWKKVPTNHPLQKDSHEPQWRFYDVDNKMETCNRYKGIFLTNARKLRPTSRLMVSNLQCCYRDPNDPAPNAYYPQNYTLVNNVSPPIISKPPNPHNFLRRSSVPAKQTYLNLSSKYGPGPGRYETRYPNFCPCTYRLVVVPNLQLIIDREKRFKFRRLPYMKIKARAYCTPDWRHVHGRGHRHIFKLPRSQKLQHQIITKEREARRSKELSKKDPKDVLKPAVKLYADARYIGMINDPNRPKISFRNEPFKEPKPKIFFNCLKRYSRRGKVSSVNKKIAFNSGQERFHIVERPTILTVSQLKKLTESLPLERQLRDQPVMKIEPGEIKSKLTAVPKHMLYDELELRKGLFKFLPLPTTKMLICEKEVQVQTEIKYFDKTLDSSLFFKKESRLTTTLQ